jgi:histidyl-tRNA synthetase
MTQKRQFKAIRGVRDILPPETALWNWFEQTARRIFEAYNYREIRLPIFEETELFARSVGWETDIVSKEMYSFWTLRESLLVLGAMRDMVASWDVKLKDTADLDAFIYQVSRLVQRPREEIESGIATRGKWSIGAVESVSQNLEKLKAARAANAGRKDLEDLIEQIKFESRIITLGDHVSLRPEATASVIRAYIEHGMHTLPGDVKLYYVGPMFRRERPQKGRYRQFYQIGAEVLGQSDHPAIDAEVIEMLTILLAECGLEPAGGSQKSEVGSQKEDARPGSSTWSLLVNSIGCAECKPKYIETLRAAVEKVKAKMCGDCQRRVETNPLRVFDCKVEADQAIIARLPAIAEHVCTDCREHFAEVQRQLKLREIPYTIAPRLVRGLDYYTRTTFEITSPALGAQNALVGGGRYDGLAELLGGPPTKGIGFALGTDRFIEAIKEAGKVKADLPVDVFVAWMGAAAYPVAVKLARRLRAEGFCVELPAEEMKLKKSLALASRIGGIGARYALIIGENEVAAGKYALKRLADGYQQSLVEEDLVRHLKTGQWGEKEKH